ncbi:hypothetical protein ACIA8R_19595 [Nonomuraea sp. NPDC051191]|uniref:hypothetical protein n=1 Tax=Nonomuraea sp. NPDC051191 TaxID=3364372 RepID=UPI0037A36AC3
MRLPAVPARPKTSSRTASVEPSGAAGRRSGWERRFPGLLASILAASPPRRPAD